MQMLARPDANLAVLAHLDVIDVRLDGSYALNAAFQAMCRAAYDADPRRYDSVIPDLIRARAAARRLVLDLDLDELVLTALEVAGAEPA